MTLTTAEEDSSPVDDTEDQDFSTEMLPQLFSQAKLNDLLHDLNPQKFGRTVGFPTERKQSP